MHSVTNSLGSDYQKIMHLDTEAQMHSMAALVTLYAVAVIGFIALFTPVQGIEIVATIIIAPLILYTIRELFYIRAAYRERDQLLSQKP